MCSRCPVPGRTLYAWTKEDGWSGDAFKDEAGAGANPARDGTGRVLKDFDANFVHRWLNDEETANAAVDDALWTVAVARAPGPAQRIMLAVRAVERTLGQVRADGNDNWADAAERYLRAPWVSFTLIHEVFDAALNAYNVIERNKPVGLFANLHAAVFAATDDPNPNTTRTHGFAAIAHIVLAEMTPGSMDHRVVRDITAVLTDPAAALERRSELRARFDTLLKRTERQRNALTHGSGTTDAVLRDVDRFAETLARYAAQEAMRQAETGQEPLVMLERLRIEGLDQDARLKVGQMTPVEVLWPAG